MGRGRGNKESQNGDSATPQTGTGDARSGAVATLEPKDHTLDAKVMEELTGELQEQSKRHRHLGAYLSAWSNDLGMPEYNSR